MHAHAFLLRPWKYGHGATKISTKYRGNPPPHKVRRVVCANAKCLRFLCATVFLFMYLSRPFRKKQNRVKLSSLSPNHLCTIVLCILSRTVRKSKSTKIERCCWLLAVWGTKCCPLLRCGQPTFDVRRSLLHSSPSDSVWTCVLNGLLSLVFVFWQSHVIVNRA